jgi:hypothetical protein
MKHGGFLATTLVVVSAAAFGGAVSAKDRAIDDNFYTYYGFDGGQAVNYFTCTTNGCTAAGMLMPFKHACALLEGPPATSGNVVTRALYIMESGKKATDDAQLYVYSKTDTIDGGDDEVAITLQQKVDLGFQAGKKAHCAMAAAGTVLFAGTDLSATYTVDKSTFAVHFSGFGSIASATADARGYVTLVAPDKTFAIFNPGGGQMVSGGGVYFMANTQDGQINGK